MRSQSVVLQRAAQGAGHGDGGDGGGHGGSGGRGRRGDRSGTSTWAASVATRELTKKSCLPSPK